MNHSSFYTLFRVTFCFVFVRGKHRLTSFDNRSICLQSVIEMSNKKGKSKGASADGDSGEASGGGKGGTSVKVLKNQY